MFVYVLKAEGLKLTFFVVWPSREEFNTQDKKEKTKWKKMRDTFNKNAYASLYLYRTYPFEYLNIFLEKK